MKLPRVAVLVDLPRENNSGGHVKFWERLAQAAVRIDAPIDLTIYFSGDAPDEIFSPHVRYRYLSPVFSTARLKFLPYVPAHTDLAPFHPELAKQLPDYDLIHTTDAYFNFARTAERLADWNGIPLLTSFHTDTPAYAELFTQQTIESLLGRKFGGFIARTFEIPKRERLKKEKRLEEHLRKCSAIFAMRPDDKGLAERLAGSEKVKPMRLAVDKNLFNAAKADRTAVEQDYKIPGGRLLVLFVGRVDAGKNMPVLLEASKDAVAKEVDLQLIVAGLGPMCKEVKEQLGERATMVGQVAVDELARLYASVDCLAMASDIEIGGLVGVEALASGCPVLVSRKSGVASLLGETTGVEEVDSEASSWVGAFIEFSNNQRQNEMRAGALEFGRDRVANWDDILQKDFLPVWQELAQRRTACSVNAS